MSVRKNNPEKWSEEEVEALLIDFFDHETPRELPKLADVADPGFRSEVSPSVISQGNRERRLAGFKGLGIAACALFLALTALSPTWKQQTSSPAPVSGVENGHSTVISAKKSVTLPVVKLDRTPPKLHRAILGVLPPEMRTPADNGVPVIVPGEPNDLGIWERFEIEVHPFSPMDPPEDNRPRLPEEGE